MGCIAPCRWQTHPAAGFEVSSVSDTAAHSLPRDGRSPAPSSQAPPGHAGRIALQTGRALVRGAGLATAAWRPLPDFLVIGAKRGASTSLYHHLLRHEQVVPLFPRPEHLPKATHTKGVHYFDSNYERGERWYRSHLPSQRSRQAVARAIGLTVVTGEASPYYLFHPLAPPRAAALLPNVRLIAQLRDPVERTFSHWKERRRAGMEPLSFVDALAAEDERIGQEAERLLDDPCAGHYAHEQQSYARQSEYVTSVRRWLEHYPSSQLLVVTTEAYVHDSQAVLDDVCDHLGLRQRELPGAERLNATRADDLAPQVRTRLEARFAPYNDQLERLLGRPLPWS